MKFKCRGKEGEEKSQEKSLTLQNDCKYCKSVARKSENDKQGGYYGE